MGCSEIAYVSACYFAARRVVPEVRIGISFVRRNVLHELFRYAGSYQLVNILEVLYNSIVPFAILRTFGANSAGVYAVVTRIVASAAILQDAFLGPILSGATAVFASGSSERMQRMLTKSFKVTLALALFPLGFVSLFGPIMARAWTGEVDPSFHTAFWLVCLTSLFRSFSLLSLVLYRVSGKALLDNIRQVLRIVVILTVALFAPTVGFYGVLAGLAFAELSGMIFMLGALMKTFHVFHVRSLVPDTVKLAAASVVVFGAGTIASQIPLPLGGAGRELAVFKLLEISFACLLVAWPALRATRSITAGEGRELLAAFRSRRGIPVGEVVDGGDEVIAL
jgi:O-antigen/teichoic acid export membrane protein